MLSRPEGQLLEARRRGVAGPRRGLYAVLAAAAFPALYACDRTPSPSESPSARPAVELVADSQPAVASAPVDPILPDSHTWTHAQAVEKLANEATAVSAALRLIRLADSHDAALPEPLPTEIAARLRVRRVSDHRRIVGIEDERDPRRWQSPRFIDETGEILPPGEGDAWTLHIAADADVFPDLLIGPGRVVNAARPSAPAIVLGSPADLRFDLRFDNGYPYVALLLPAADADVEVSRFTWEPYEETFTGPAVDKLPTPPGGVFRIDIEASAALQPVGGLIEEPDPVTKLPPAVGPDEDDLPPPY